MVGVIADKGKTEDWVLRGGDDVTIPHQTDSDSHSADLTVGILKIYVLVR